MSQSPRNKGGNNKRNPDNKSAVNQSSNAKQKEVETADNCGNGKCHCCNSYNIPPQEKDGSEKNMRRWNRFGIVINTILSVATIVIIWYNIKATESSVKSANIADSTFQQVKEQFEIVNKPYLQFREFKISFIDEVRRIRFEPKLTNYGNHPVKVTMYRMAVLYDTTVTDIYTQINFTKPERYQLVEAYYMKEKPEGFPLHTESTLPEMIFEGAWSGFYSIYVWGELMYENIVTGKKRRYEFIVRLKKRGELAEEAILFNRNEDVK